MTVHAPTLELTSALHRRSQGAIVGKVLYESEQNPGRYLVQNVPQPEAVVAPEIRD